MSFFDDASLVMIPSGYKTSKVYSVKPTDGSGDLAFTRSNDTATRVGPDGLIEKVRTNLALYSEDLTNAAWTKEGVTISANATTSPFGSLTADKVIASASAGDKYVAEILTGINGVTYTSSAYFKASEYTYAFIRLGGITGNPYVIYNLATQAVVATSGLTTSTITSVGNGWYRVTATATQTSTTLAPVLMVIPSTGYTLGGDNIVEFTGNGTSGGFIFGLQVESNDVATPYIATTAAAVSVGPLANVPRLDYLNSSCPRLLLEGQRTNVFTFSEQFDNAVWTKYQASISANAATSPDGYTNADKIVDTAVNDIHAVYRGYALSANSTISFFVKAAEYSRIAIVNLSDGGEVVFNLTTATVVSTAANFTNSKIESYGSGWYRILATTNGVTGSKAIGLMLVNNSGATTFTGTGTSGILVYGAQLEDSASYATSYIPTLGAAVTRGADACSKTGISSLIGQTEGTLFLEVKAQLDTTDAQDFSISDGTTTNRAAIRLSSSGLIQGVGVFGGNVEFSIGSGSYVTGQSYKIALAYKLNDVALYVNGVQAGTDTSATISGTLSRLGFDVFTTGSQIIVSPVKQALLFKTRLSNADLAALTA